MIKPRSRFNPARLPVKPAPNAGLTLFVDAAAVTSLWPRLVLAEKDIDSARIEVIRRDRPHEDFLVLNPQGTLPALADREGVICGARIISEYLNERYPHPPLMPLGPALRAHVRMRMQLLEDVVFPAIAEVGVDAPLPLSAQESLVDAFRQRETRGPAHGDSGDYTLADCAWTAVFWHLRSLGVELPADVRGLRNWSEALLSRSAVKRALKQ